MMKYKNAGIGVVLRNIAVKDKQHRLLGWFPEREFFMRSRGQVRFIKISSRLQMVVAALVLALLAVWAITMAALALSQFASTQDRLSLLNREASVTTAENRVSSYRKGLDGVAADLGRRQDVIEKMVQAHIGGLPKDARAGETVSDSGQAANQTVKKVSMAIPEAAGLAKVEAEQLGFVENLTRYADRRAAAAAGAIRKLGLNPEAMVAQINDSRAEGGPLQLLSTDAHGGLDPRFQRLGMSLARMDVLEHGLQGIPQFLPASLQYISSGFGYRSDPFNGRGAFHAGLDFRGPYGSPIYSAARGVVSFAGVRSGYGNCVEISHGNGLLTRYAHMSKFHTHQGETVVAGQVIGAIGSTGRSTGPHLHFEVRINDRPVNPRPFLEAAPHVLEEVRNQNGPQPVTLRH